MCTLPYLTYKIPSCKVPTLGTSVFEVQPLSEPQPRSLFTFTFTYLTLPNFTYRRLSLLPPCLCFLEEANPVIVHLPTKPGKPSLENLCMQ